MLRQSADPRTAGVAVPEIARAVDVEPVRRGVGLAQLDLCHSLSVLRVELVDGVIVRVDAPQHALVPRQTVRTLGCARPWYASNDLPGLRLHQEDFAARRYRHPVLAVDPLDAVPARR